MKDIFFEWQDKNWRTHWWYVNRVRLFKKELQRAEIGFESHILDIGSATGNNIQMLMEMGFTDIEGLEPDKNAIAFCHRKNLDRITQGKFGKGRMPFEDSSFDMIMATDVLEHIIDDAFAVREITRILRPGGQVLITVPAFQSLWGLQDSIGFHKRRYRRKQLLDLLRVNGITVDETDCFYFNYILFGPIYIARKIVNLMIKIKNNCIKSEGHVNTPMLNWLFDKIFHIDILTARSLKIPFGVSLYALGKKII